MYSRNTIFSSSLHSSLARRTLSLAALSRHTRRTPLARRISSPSTHNTQLLSSPLSHTPLATHKPQLLSSPQEYLKMSTGGRSKGKGVMKEGDKMRVTLQFGGSVTGPYAGTWSDRVGKLIRQIIPVDYSDFRDVPIHFTRDVFDRLMNDFEIEPAMLEEKAFKLAQKKWAQYYRTHKYSLRAQLAASDEIPMGHDTIVIEKFLQVEKQPKKKKKQRNDGSINRAKCVVSHNLGRDTYTRRAEKEALKNPDKAISSRDDMWLLGHENKSGQCASIGNLTVYEKVKEARDKRKESGTTTQIDFDNDAVVEVLGQDRRGRIRGYDSNVSRRQLEALQLAELKGKQGRSAMQEEVSLQMQNVTQNIIDGIKGFIYNVVDTRIAENASGTPISDKCSNSGAQRRVVEVEPMQTVDEEHDEQGTDEEKNPTVVLVNKKRKAVAKGLPVTESHKNICHGRPVAPNERKNFIQKVIDPNEPPLHPDFEDKLTERTWTTWYASRLVFMDI